jgi:hypothetical protein
MTAGELAAAAPPPSLADHLELAFRLLGSRIYLTSLPGGPTARTGAPAG